MHDFTGCTVITVHVTDLFCTEEHLGDLPWRIESSTNAASCAKYVAGPRSQTSVKEVTQAYAGARREEQLNTRGTGVSRMCEQKI